jgi:hypothetical protein
LSIARFLLLSATAPLKMPPAIPSTRIVAMKAKIVTPARTRTIEINRVESFDGTVSSPVRELVTTAR